MILNFKTSPRYRVIPERDWIFASEALMAEGWRFYEYVWKNNKIDGVVIERWVNEIC